MTFTKQRADAAGGFFEAEAAGLAWLADAAGARIVRVDAVRPGRIDLERIAEVAPTPAAARAFGADLARTHNAGALAFGSRPDGWDGPLYIGSREMPAGTDASWGRFYVANRIEPFLVGDDPVVRRACAIVASGAFDDDEPPARIHGDLWNGNVLWSAEGAVLIDPAAHGGHRETDLAMLELFGCPYLSLVLEGYESVTRLASGWRERIPLHQLHPLAVHARGHGPHYAVALTEAARRVVELAG